MRAALLIVAFVFAMIWVMDATSQTIVLCKQCHTCEVQTFQYGCPAGWMRVY